MVFLPSWTFPARNWEMAHLAPEGNILSNTCKHSVLFFKNLRIQSKSFINSVTAILLSFSLFSIRSGSVFPGKCWLRSPRAVVLLWVHGFEFERRRLERGRERSWLGWWRRIGQKCSWHQKLTQLQCRWHWKWNNFHKADWRTWRRSCGGS